MTARLCAFLVWALVAASAAFWGLRLIARAPQAPTHVAVAGGAAPVAAGDLTRLFGAAPVTPMAPRPDAAARFKLTGVIAPRAGQPQGVALISVDGKLPRAYRVGSRIDGEWVLQNVSLRSASLGPTSGSATAVLELPPPAPAATGSRLPPPMASPVAAPVPAAPTPMPQIAPVAPQVAAPPLASPLGGDMAPPPPGQPQPAEASAPSGTGNALPRQ